MGISGRYKEVFQTQQARRAKGTELELRIDVDSEQPMQIVSGDIYSTLGRTPKYLGSFRFEQVKVEEENDDLLITGSQGFPFESYSKIIVTVPKNSNPLTATVELSDGLGNSSESTCVFESPRFRSVDLENDYETNVNPFISYDSGSLESPVPPKIRTVKQAYTEAGIDLCDEDCTPNEIETAECGANSAWSDSELHAAIVQYFSLLKDKPQWRVWLFSAGNYEAAGYYGLMFDQKGKPRQGCAVFHNSINNYFRGDNEKRLQLFLYVHEIGHCFNLVHPWEKIGSGTTPAGKAEYSTLTWMNYPWNYQSETESGKEAFWKAFPFKFADSEIAHLRHGARNDVIPGGRKFRGNAGARLVYPPSEEDTELDSSLDNEPGLHLRLESPLKKTQFGYGEPVVVEIKLSTNQGQEQAHLIGSSSGSINGCLHPKTGLLQINICDPNDDVVTYKPLMTPSVLPETATIDPDHPVYESAYIGYGKDGFYFSQPGVYKIRAIYTAVNGSIVPSNILRLGVCYPHSADDEEVAGLLTGDQQGTLLYLKGSHSPFLQKGNDDINRLQNEYTDHPLTMYARFIQGYNSARGFKLLKPNKKIERIDPSLEIAEKLLKPVIGASEAFKGIDNVSLNLAMRQLARVQKAVGREDEAIKTVEHAKYIFKNRVKPKVYKEIEKQVDQTLSPQ